MRWHFVLGILLVLDVAVISGQNKKVDVELPQERTSSAVNEKPVEAAVNQAQETAAPTAAQNPGAKASDGASTAAQTRASTKTAPKPENKAKDSAPTTGSHQASAAQPKPTKTTVKPEVNADDPKPTAASHQETTTVTVLSQKVGLDKVKSARILVVLPFPFYSHTKNFMPIFKELAKRGHNITMVSPYPQKEPMPNWEDIVTENVLEKMWASLPTKDFTEMHQNLFAKLVGLVFFADVTMPLLVDMPEVMDLYKDDSREYDLVFVEAQFVQEPLLAFGWKYKAPVIALYPSYYTPELAYYTGNPVFTSNYVPNMVFSTSNRMSLYQRFENTAFTVLKLLVYNGFYLPKMDSYMRQYFPAEDRPYIADLLFNVSFTLLDSNPALTYPYPRANNMREFLGVNTKPDKPLDLELQEIMDGADKHGVLLFTLGSHYQTSTLKPHILQSIIHAFSKIPQKVIMKWDKDEPPPNLSPNVHTLKWVPQSGILQHKNCRAFFTHTGVHGVMEAMDNGVPIISLPLFADQEFFATWAEETGVGKMINHRTVTPEIAEAVVKDVLNDPKYKEKAMGVSILIKDVPMPTIDEVVYWVEHVIRTKGARHLRPGSLSLWWYQRFGLDVLAIALALILVPLWITIRFLKCLCSVCRGKKKSTQREKELMKSKKQN